MAKVWAWILIAIIAILGIIWLVDYGYKANSLCRDDYGRYYQCEKRYYNQESNYRTYVYYDKYGNRVVSEKSNYPGFDDYYDCYHAGWKDSRYGQLLRENSGIICHDNEVVYSMDNYKQSYAEKPPIIYVA